jgi:dipeptidyl aminopeptidase/acylaminoacyl peptidase
MEHASPEMGRGNGSRGRRLRPLKHLRPGRRVVAVALGALLAVLVGGYLVASNVVYDRLTVVDRAWCPTYASFAGATPAAFRTGSKDTGPFVDTTPYLMPGYQSVRFPSRDPAITIAGWWVPGATVDAPAIVLVHGVGRCKGDPEVLLPAGMLHRHGFAVLLIDLRNHGDSSAGAGGRYGGGVAEYRDVLGAWDWLQAAQHLAANRIGLYGVSLGAGTVMIATGEEPRVAAAWEDSGFADATVGIQDELARNGYPGFLAFGGLLVGRAFHGVDLTSLSPLGEVPKLVGRPLFIVHGAADDRIPVKHAELLAAAFRAHGGPVDPWIVPGVGHVRAAFVVTTEYERRLAAFFAGSLGAPSASSG